MLKCMSCEIKRIHQKNMFPYIVIIFKSLRFTIYIFVLIFIRFRLDQRVRKANDSLSA